MIVTEPPHLPVIPALPASKLRAAGSRSPDLLTPDSRPGRPPFRKRELSRFLALATESAGLVGKVSVLLTDDATIRELNRRFRKQDKATDVLSFPPASVPASGTLTVRKRSKQAGDVAISLTTAAEQANLFGHSLEVEVKILLLHGILHLAGFDHEIDGGGMARKESAMRKKLGLPRGLIARNGKTGKQATAKTHVSEARRGAPLVGKPSEKTAAPKRRGTPR